MISVRSFLALSLVTLLNLNVHAATSGGITGDGGSVYDGKIADIYWQDSSVCHIPGDAIDFQFQYASDLNSALTVIKTIIDPKEAKNFDLNLYKLVIVKKLSGQDSVMVNGEEAHQMAFSYVTCGTTKIKVIEVIQDFFVLWPPLH